MPCAWADQRLAFMLNSGSAGDNVLYEIHVATGSDLAAGKPTFSYQFKFETKVKNDRTILLAGERDGLRIGAALTGGTEFDLGNSPREFADSRIRGHGIVMTTTNGTRALRACAVKRSPRGS